MSEEEMKLSHFGCGISCPMVEQKIMEMKELRQILREKEKEIKKLESIKINLEKMKLSKNEIQSLFYDILSQIHPFYDYIYRRVSSIDKIGSVLVSKNDDIYDIWFIIKDSNFTLESMISEIFCDVVRRFNSLNFDILIIYEKKINKQELKEKGFKVIYNRK